MAQIKFENGATVTFDGTPTQQDIEEASRHAMQLKPVQPVQPEKTSGVLDAFGKGLKNIKESIIESGKGVNEVLDRDISTPLKMIGVFGKILKPYTQIAAESVMTPLRVQGEAIEAITGKDINTAVANLAQSAVQKGMDTEQAKKAIDFYENHIKGDPEAETALGALLDIVDFATIGVGGGTAASEVTSRVIKPTVKKAAEATKTAAKGAAKTGEFGVAQTFGFQPGTIQAIIRKPGVFTAKQMEAIDRESIFNKVKTGIEKRLENLRATGKEYEAIKKSSKRANISGQDIKDFLKSKGLEVKDGKVRATLGSDIQLSKADANGLSEVVKLIGNKKNLTAKEVLNLRTRLSNLAKFEQGKTDASKIVARELRKKIDAIAKRDIPGLKELDAKFAPERKRLYKLKKIIFNADGSVKDNAISKIATLTGRGKEQTLKQMEKIIPGITEDVNILRAIEDIKAAQGKTVGTYMRTGIGVGGGAIAGGPVGAIIGALLTSPTIGVSLIRAYGRAKKISSNVINRIVKKMKTGQKLVSKEKQIMEDALNEAARKAGKKAKNIRPGLTIKDVSKMGVETNKFGGRLHPDDTRDLIKFIDDVRIGDKKKPIIDNVDAIFEKLGISLDQPLWRLANKAEAILTGKIDASKLYKVGRLPKKVKIKK